MPLAIGIRAQKHASPAAEPLREVFRRKHIPGDAGSACTAHILVYFHRNAGEIPETLEMRLWAPRVFTYELSPTT
jgi:hypothetical protein